MDIANGNDMQQTNSTINTTYANAVIKGKNASSDVSNNNPSIDKSGNGNPPVPNQSAIIEDATICSNTPDSVSDSFEDAEENQVEIQSLPVTNISPTVSKVNVSESLISALNSEDKNVSDVNEAVSSYDCSGDESDLEDSASDSNSVPCPCSLPLRMRSVDPDVQLPSTVTVLTGENGSKVYLVGTAHFSRESQDDVVKTIKAVQPNIVMLEICNSRIFLLSVDEEHVLEEANNLNFQKIKTIIQQNGFLQGGLHCLLLHTTAHCTKQLGMAPGGEFKKAFTEAQNVPGCVVQMGDRPIHITLQRTLATLSLWQKMKIAYHLLSKEPITKEDVERCKQKDLLEEVMAEMMGQHPEFTEIFVNERDLYLAYSLQIAAKGLVNPHRERAVFSPQVVVGVVGIGHVRGIVKNWGKVTEEDVRAILHIPEPSKFNKFIRITLRATFYCGLLYGAYRIFPRSLVPNKVQSFLQEIPKTALTKLFSQRSS